MVAQKPFKRNEECVHVLILVIFSMGFREGIFYKKRKVERELQRNLLLYTEMMNDEGLSWFFFCTSVWSSVCMLSCPDDVLLHSFISHLN